MIDRKKVTVSKGEVPQNKAAHLNMRKMEKCGKNEKGLVWALIKK